MYRVNLRSAWFVEKANVPMKNGLIVKTELRMKKKELHAGKDRRNPRTRRDFNICV